MNSMVSMEIKRCNFLPEGEMAIIKDTNTLIHNIVDSELKEKDKEIERLNNIIDIKTNRIQQLMKRLSKRQEKVDRLNNIIDEIEKSLLLEINKLNTPQLETLSELHRVVRLEAMSNILNTLKELKEGK